MSRSRILRRSVLLGTLAAALGLVSPRPAWASPTARFKADRIVVTKSARRLDLVRGAVVIRSYPIRLGEHPVGPKVFQLDGRTPEGEYVIDWRTRATHYHLALHISYPQPENIVRAAKYHLPPGGAIFIHGTPGTDKRFQRDWTDGCIAVSNRAIEEIWKAVDNGTPVEIRP